MINFMLGPPGGGKSYETTVYHVLPALEAGRKVITNLPLNIELFLAIDARYADLLEIRQAEEGKPLPFSQVEQYKTDWRHPLTNQGPLLIIDECQEVMRRGKTSKALCELAAMHRHYGQDWLLLTQSYGKIDREICDLVQITYYVSKLSVFGRNDEYVRKVFSGLKSGSKKPVQQEVRKYNPAYFKFYTSHTASDKAVQEAMAGDISPMYKRIRRFGLAFLMIFLILAPVAYYQYRHTTAQDKQTQKPKTETITPANQGQSARVESGQTPSINRPRKLAETTGDIKREPFDGMTFYIRGNIIGKDHQVWLFSVTRDGVDVLFQTGEELAKAGYKIRAVNDCLVIVDHPALNEPKYVYCGTGMTSRPQTVPTAAPMQNKTVSELN